VIWGKTPPEHYNGFLTENEFTILFSTPSPVSGMQLAEGGVLPYGQMTPSTEKYFQYSPPDIMARFLLQLRPTLTKAKIDFDSLNETATRRTLELSAANRRLKRSIARHKIAETTLKKKNEHYSKLLKDSLQLQDGLRQLTRNLLTAQEAERHKISHDLQDEIAQTLLGINVRLLSLRHVTQGSTKALRRKSRARSGS
jgi:uncharacterized protein YdcH (DUF465 family)